MKRYLTLLWATLLCACSLVLVACGGSSEKAASEEGTAETAAEETPEVAVDPAEKFYGTWKLGSMSAQGMIIVGDFSSMLGSEDEAETEMTITLTIDEGGTGTMAMADDEGKLTWTLKDDNTLSITPVKDADDEAEADVEPEADAEASDEGVEEVIDGAEELLSENESHDIVYREDGTLVLTADADGETMEMVFSADGTIEGYPVLSLDDAKPVTSAEEFVGSWKLSGMIMGSATAYGDLSQISGADEETDMSITINENGTAVMMGEDATWAIDESGATVDLGGYGVTLKMLDDKLLFDMGEIIQGFGMAMVYTK